MNNEMYDLSQKITDAYNALGYDASNIHEQCPGVKAWSGDLEKICRYLYTAQCRVLNHVDEHKDERVGGRTHIAFGICGDLLTTTRDAIPDVIGCEMRAKLLELFDKYQAEGRYSDAERNFFRAVGQAADGYIESVDGREVFSERESGRTPYSEEAMVLAYEKWQYDRRKEQGEPVIWHAGRCLFDGAVFAKGIRPGPFPGLDLYMSDGHLVDSKWFQNWLVSSAAERQRLNLHPVGYCGQALCALRFSDILRYYAKWKFVFGPETYRRYIRRDRSWVPSLFEDVC